MLKMILRKSPWLSVPNIAKIAMAFGAYLKGSAGAGEGTVVDDNVFAGTVLPKAVGAFETNGIVAGGNVTIADANIFAAIYIDAIGIYPGTQAAQQGDAIYYSIIGMPQVQGPVGRFFEGNIPHGNVGGFVDINEPDFGLHGVVALHGDARPACIVGFFFNKHVHFTQGRPYPPGLPVQAAFAIKAYMRYAVAIKEGLLIGQGCLVIGHIRPAAGFVMCRVGTGIQGSTCFQVKRNAATQVELAAAVLTGRKVKCTTALLVALVDEALQSGSAHAVFVGYHAVLGHIDPAWLRSSQQCTAGCHPYQQQAALYVIKRSKHKK
ncbi:MAG: hypothetical protein MUF62_13895 [Chitinophagaceae bacterium]|nr:hypothetical protein [Chitinophagaceae bacterium]